MNHKKIEAKSAVMGVMVAILVSIGGIVEIVPVGYDGESLEPCFGSLIFRGTIVDRVFLDNFASVGVESYLFSFNGCSLMCHFSDSPFGKDDHKLHREDGWGGEPEKYKVGIPFSESLYTLG